MADNVDVSGMPPGFFVGPGTGNGGQMGLGNRISNPFMGIPMTFLPLNVEMQLFWAQHFAFRFGFFRSACSRIANYFITQLTVDCDDNEAKLKYEEIFKDMQWKEVLAKAGLDLLLYGNMFASIAQGFNRFLQCPNCHRVTNIEKLDDYEFSAEGKYTCVCPGCNNKSTHQVIDKSTKDLKKLQVIFWGPREIEVRFDRATNSAEYFWKIPGEYSAKVTLPNNKFYSKVVPQPIYDAIYKKKMFIFNDKNFIHLKVPTPSGIPTEGKAMPLCIYLFDDFFMLKVMERYNQTLMFEDIVPFRVFSMAQQGNGNTQINPVIHQNAPQWTANIHKMIREHRQDPGSYHTFPFQFQYDHLGGDATKLAPTELIQNTIGNILNALNIPQELYTMTLQTQAVSPALRLFENSWSFMIDTYNNLLQEWADIVSKIQGLPKATVKLQAVTLSDDMERKSVIGQLVSANAIARSELLNIYGLDYRTQVKKKNDEDQINKEIQEEQALKDQVTQMSQAGDGQMQGGTSPTDVMDKATQIAQQLLPMDGAQRRQQLQQIKASDQQMYSIVKMKLEELTSGAKSQGLQSAKQQGQQGGPGQ